MDAVTNDQVERFISAVERIAHGLSAPTQEGKFGDGIPTLADAVFELAGDLKYAVLQLGNADASTQMGAIEGLGAVLKEGLDAIASAVTES